MYFIARSVQLTNNNNLTDLQQITFGERSRLFHTKVSSYKRIGMDATIRLPEADHGTILIPAYLSISFFSL